MSKELEQPEPKSPQVRTENDFVPLRLPSFITPFNLGEVLSIQSMNEKHKQQPQSNPQEKK